MTNDRELTAFHEAGHAVARYLRGLAIEYVTIIGTEVYRGYTEVPGPQVVRLLDSVEIAFAGPWAQARREWPLATLVLPPEPDGDWPEDDAGLTFPDYVMGAILTGGDGDFAVIEDARARIGHPVETSWSMTHKLEPEWPAITAVAHALLDAGTLSGDDVARIVEGVSPPGE